MIEEEVENLFKPLVMRYEHGCDVCQPLGMMGFFDLYYCEKLEGHPTVIARYGDQGYEYFSGMTGNHPVLKIAKLMALEEI